MIQEEVDFLHISPVLSSSDILKDIAWYESLGFQNVYDSSNYQDGPLDYAVIGRQNLFFHLQFQYPKDVIISDVKFRITGIHALINDFVEKGLLSRDQVFEKTAWNTCEFGLFDPTGNRITFFEDL